MNQNELLTLFNDEQDIYTVPEIAAIVGQCNKAVSRKMGKLAEWGFVKRIYRKGRLAPIYMRNEDK